MGRHHRRFIGPILTERHSTRFQGVGRSHTSSRGRSHGGSHRFYGRQGARSTLHHLLTRFMGDPIFTLSRGQMTGTSSSGRGRRSGRGTMVIPGQSSQVSHRIGANVHSQASQSMGSIRGYNEPDHPGTHYLGVDHGGSTGGSLGRGRRTRGQHCRTGRTTWSKLVRIGLGRLPLIRASPFTNGRRNGN